jgi:hypothetical protein
MTFALIELTDIQYNSGIIRRKANEMKKLRNCFRATYPSREGTLTGEWRSAKYGRKEQRHIFAYPRSREW